MLSGPFENECKRTPRQPATNHPQSSYVDKCLVLSIQRMKMRGRVIGSEHLDNDAVEDADCGHH
jgi:hypothetical protein